ncbi:MAG TPA: hypothetical protein VHD60_01455 [Candidatus Saccharimonadales bacterium]|nr:hypothetical protein [Candidatus Saccharimonadales bacterium]
MQLSRYSTGPVAFLQAGVMVVLNIINAVVNSSGVQMSIAYLILIFIWFGFIAVLAYAVEDRRSRSLAFLLGAIEFMVAVAALYDLYKLSSPLSFLTSLCDFVLALVVVYLSYQLLTTGKARAAKPRPRHAVKRH